MNEKIEIIASKGPPKLDIIPSRIADTATLYSRVSRIETALVSREISVVDRFVLIIGRLRLMAIISTNIGLHLKAEQYLKEADKFYKATDGDTKNELNKMVNRQLVIQDGQKKIVGLTYLEQIIKALTEVKPPQKD